jgi:DNA-binding beta-propeller fold protein YncE
MLAVIVVGCASHKPIAPAPPRPVSFTSADGRVTATIHGPLRREPIKLSAQKRLERFLYGPEDEPASVLRRPQGITSAGGFLYIADQGLPDVLRYDLANRTYTRWIRSGDRPTCPIAAAADDAGRVYVADAAKRTVLLFDNQGHREPDLSPDPDGSGLFRPGALLVHGGIVYVADGNARQVRRYDFAMHAWLIPIGPGSGDDALAMPAGLAMTPRGELLVTDAILGLIHRFDADGKPLKPIGEYGAETGQLIRPMGIACTPSGVVLVADAGRESVMAFDRDGAFLFEIAGPSGDWNGFIMPTGIAVLPGYESITNPTDKAENAGGSQPEWAVVSDTMRGSLTLLNIHRTPPG